MIAKTKKYRRVYVWFSDVSVPLDCYHVYMAHGYTRMYTGRLCDVYLAVSWRIMTTVHRYVVIIPRHWSDDHWSAVRNNHEVNT